MRMALYPVLWISLGLCFSFVAMPAADLEAERTWASNDGKTMRAKLIDASDFQALQFKLSDGRTAKIPLSRLADSEQDLIVAHQKEIEAATQSAQAVPEEIAPLPKKHRIKGVPMVEQYGNFCVPASAAMIANFHDVKIDQYEIAQLSSAGSIGNEGTYPRDMKIALEKIGFMGRELRWIESAVFLEEVIPKIRNSLFREGPIYVSFSPGVFGSTGHGCVIVGYDHRKEKLYFHNPWGNEFEKSYDSVALESRGLVFIEPPKAQPVATEASITDFKNKLPKIEGDLSHLYTQLKQNQIDFDLLWCNRYDTLEDRNFADDTARRDGRLILKLAFRRNPAVIIPNSPKGNTQSYYFVTRAPQGGAQYLVREISPQGWSQPQLKTLGSLTREWPTLIENKSGKKILWQLPLFEIAL
jgi:hypothetical protein